jgi:AcrR family transcriptional regulator
LLTELEDGREMALAGELRHGSPRTPASPSQPAATDRSRVVQSGKRRLSPTARRELILAEAIRYFAEVGFDGSTRELAQRVGVKQPLLYRYFPSKDDLIKHVYEMVYVRRWRRDWDTLISDRRIPLRARLIQFYHAYAQVMFEREWIRIYFFSGLKGLDINKRYIEFMEKHVLRKICEEIRHAYDLPSLQEVPVTPQELAAFWLFHGGVFYYGVRREVYGVPVHVNVEQLTELGVDSLLGGFPHLAKRIIAEGAVAVERSGPHRSKRRPRR